MPTAGGTSGGACGVRAGSPPSCCARLSGSRPPVPHPFSALPPLPQAAGRGTAAYPPRPARPAPATAARCEAAQQAAAGPRHCCFYAAATQAACMQRGAPAGRPCVGLSFSWRLGVVWRAVDAPHRVNRTLLTSCMVCSKSGVVLVSGTCAVGRGTDRRAHCRTAATDRASSPHPISQAVGLTLPCAACAS